MRAAFSNVDGLPAATHIGGCGSEYGFGSTLRGGIEKYVPSCPAYSSARHILRNSPTTSSNMSRVRSGSVMPNPFCSVVDEPRPMPNSKRPSERWSSSATRSAIRAGWFTGGVTLKMPDPRWIVDVAAAR